VERRFSTGFSTKVTHDEDMIVAPRSRFRTIRDNLYILSAGHLTRSWSPFGEVQQDLLLSSLTIG